MSKVQAVPTNIITGALGVGKTTLILSLLTQKPANEKWAVLVNEFGEVGIDGALMNAPDQQVFIREVPGGCMCCTSGLPMQIALNQLLATAKPDRLLIEPTGLGHPKEVLQTLSESHYQEVLKLQSTLTLIDARKLRSQRWREHPTFREQLEIADAIVVTKSEHYEPQENHNLIAHLKEVGVSDKPRVYTHTEPLALSLLNDLERQSEQLKLNAQEYEHHQNHSHDHSHHHKLEDHYYQPSPIELGEGSQDVYKVANHGQGFFSYGWICSGQRKFELDKLKTLFGAIDTERLKAVMQTEQGTYGFNLADGSLEVTQHTYDKDSRIEFLSDDEQQAIKIADQIEIELGLRV
ncbi:GTP-binding protein [Alteromonas sp. ASW11-36]|uniref:GTP-binding protein n=1 Tax=Alteromonas arenosi TaxID=3055817 RepID=A0ABT7SW74_9ALTE|nr:GTP-binding protein [Alteromonas sp. ASW11-36]MDM7860442.1 GTP-binding protein [Alteromonas sp. ASW11-36]